ncbi:MAG TPA: hypothetical protein VKA26_14295 [Ignavibacteriaceae bacterium]|nr:hypothetical protein [Ignavibacteriaceae bacterium]
MIKYFKEKIANFIVNRKLKKKDTNHQSFSKIFQRAFNILVIMPENEEDFNQSMEVLKFLDEQGKHITVFSYDFRRSLIDQKYRPATIEYGLIDVSKLKLPSKKLVNKLSDKSFDAVIDLNRGKNLFCSFSGNLVKSSMRVGFKKSNSDKFYNIQINDNEDNPKISYKNLLNCLQMF